MSTANKVKAEIFIGGDEISYFTYLKLNQSFNNHHEFELHLSLFDLNQAGHFDIYKSRTWIGKEITIELLNLLGESANKFKGIVTKVSMVQMHGQSGGFVLSGYSPTIKLDGGAIMRSFNNKDIQSIVSDVMAPAGTPTQIKVGRNTELGYFTQYKESSFDFINRVSALYGEWFYYNGQSLCFGMPDKLPEVSLVYGRDISEMDLSIRVAHLNFSNFSYSSEEDEVFSGTAKSDPGALSEHSRFAIEQSEETFSIGNNTPLRNRVKNQKELDDLLKVKKAAVSNDLVGLNAVGDNPKVCIGGIAKVSVSQRAGDIFEQKEQGDYLVLSVTHEIRNNNEYQNQFYAIDAGAEVIPVYNIKTPIAETQVAKVVDNKDPKGTGRVKVQMLWQKNADKTEWVRVLTPDAGSSDKVSKNRGFAFVPEVGDQVLVGFRYNDPNRPFVMGSMYHDKIGSGGGHTNKTKALTTRSGNTIILDDSNGSINVKDPSGNVITMHGNGQVTLTAPNSFTINTKDFVVNASNSIAINAQPGQEGGGEGTIAISAKKTIAATADTEGITLDATTLGIAITGKTDVSIESTSATAKVSGKTETNIDGADVKVTGGATIRINSSDTDIT